MEEREQYSTEWRDMYDVWKTSKEMLAYRGYEFDASELEVSITEFVREYSKNDGTVDRNKLNYSARPTPELIAKYIDPQKPNEEPKIGTVFVEFCGDASIGVKQLRTFIHTIEENHHFTGIFISPKAVTGAATKLVPTVHPKVIELFEEQELKRNIVKHTLVPDHQLLSPEDTRRMLSRNSNDAFKMTKLQLPRIQKYDPVAKYLALRNGDVVKIIRPSETAGRYATYRYCG